ncbi:MAG: DUF5317 domain-containing protein [Desulfitobacteriaceae bacterium]|nr:DUF5317 domain-containing protein [Desulfitobacteriaceae bacterium]MDI6879585.1 DUF5317 domain-containing protein [Desulfitobacteriaceae bacterium]MDI6913230.1 DUF5317 domain-containing protein [Desulfitobacteriaceae bacterium]
MLIETVILAFLLSFIFRGKITNISRLHFKGVGLVPLSLAMQGLVYWAAVQGISLGGPWVGPFLDTASYIILLGFALVNRSVAGMGFVALGILFNGLVVGLNQGLMPVEPVHLPEVTRQTLLAGQGTHGLLTSSTKLAFLADRFYVGIPKWGKQLFSVGDLLLDLGVFILILAQSLGRDVSSFGRLRSKTRAQHRENSRVP